jgi:hypothetical protein
MIRIDGRGAVYGEVWFDEDLPGDAGVDIVHYHQREAPIADAKTTPFLSLVTDLTAGQEAIMEQFSKDCRYKIRRVEAKDGLRMEFTTDPENRLEEFCEFFDAFARQKSLEPANRQWLIAACKAALARDFEVQGAGNAAVRLGRTVRGRIHPRTRRSQ